MKTIDLTNGKIINSLVKLSLPIIITNFIQTAYGMIDMIWIGRLGSDSVAAIGTASFFINLALAIFTLVLIGTGVKLSHAIGKDDSESKSFYINNSIVLTLIIGIAYTIFLCIFKKSLIGFYDLNNQYVVNMAENYLVLSSLGIIFMFFNSLFTTILNSYGNSKIPFRANTIGFIFNMVLDPILIFGAGNFKGLGVSGAAIATLIARIVVLLVFVFISYKNIKNIFKDFKLDLKRAFEVIKMGMPITLQRVTFILISMVIAKIVANFGATAIAVQKVGVQIESISYITIGGLQGAIAAYVGQNYGAKKFDRIKEGYFKGLIMTIAFGSLVSFIFILFPEPIFKIFLNSNEALTMGSSYMKILGISQVFMCMELFTVGAFNGIGKTFIPPIISVIFSALRIPFAIILSKSYLFGIDGIWLSISISSIFKGVILVIWFMFNFKKLKKEVQ
ncbi:MATE family efflux transporter [Clostridium chrysemydis]|uniref:MATE family efflux transporter n=1 Tax=Clostridium chrysemydis TaxID=2665504 RepID=UPI003F3FDFF5